MKDAGRRRAKRQPSERAAARLARKRDYRAALGEHIADAARLIAEGRFDEARRAFDASVRGEAGDPRVRLSPDPAAPLLQRPVFVCGLHRSGTTLLVDRLKARFDLAWLQNIRVPEAEGQFVQDVYPQEMPFGGPGSFAFAAQMRLRPVTDPDAARAQAQRLSACWGRFAAGGARLLEKSPSNIVRIGYLRSLFPDARFVVWTRDPRAVSLATQKWRPRSDLGTLMLHWSAAHYAALEDLHDDCILARYEDLCDDPEGELDRIGRFCELAERTAVLPSQERFEEIRNSNPKYVAEFPPEALRIPGLPSWELFGYQLGRERRRAPTDAVASIEAPAASAAPLAAPATSRKPAKPAAAADRPKRAARRRGPVPAGDIVETASGEA